MPLLTLNDASTSSLSIRAKALVFEDPKSRAALDRLRQIAPSDATVLITGRDRPRAKRSSRVTCTT